MSQHESSVDFVATTWLDTYSSNLRSSLPQLIVERQKTKDPTYLDLTIYEPTETRCCHLNGAVAREYGLPTGYNICYDGILMVFDSQSGKFDFQITPHVYMYTTDADGEMNVLDLFSGQAFSDGQTRRGMGNQKMRDMAKAKNANHLLTDLGDGIIALHGKVSEIQRIFGLEHLTFNGFWSKYGQNGVVSLKDIPDMPME